MNQLKAIRKQRNISQADVAAELGIKPAAVSKYETGRVPLSEDSIEKLCSYLKVSADELLGLTSNTVSPSTQGPSMLSKVMGQIDPSSISLEDYLSTLLNTIARQKKQMDQTVRNLNACGIPSATIAKVTAINEDEINRLLNLK